MAVVVRISTTLLADRCLPGEREGAEQTRLHSAMDCSPSLHLRRQAEEVAMDLAPQDREDSSQADEVASHVSQAAGVPLESRSGHLPEVPEA